MNKFRGIITPICTPFAASTEAIDQHALERLIDFQLSNGVHGIITCAGTGQFSALSIEERKLVTTLTIGWVRDRVPVIVHTGACSTRDAIELSRHATEEHAEALLISPPYYEVPNDAEIVGHYRAIAEISPLPIMIYNNPYASKIHIRGRLLQQLCEIRNVSMLKEASGDLVQFQRVLAEFRGRLTVFNGWDTGAFATLLQGAVGCAWGAANATPSECVALYRLIVEDNDIDGAKLLWDKLFPLNDFFETEGYVSSIKAAAKLLGMDLGVNRAPLEHLNPKGVEKLKPLLSPFM